MKAQNIIYGLIALAIAVIITTSAVIPIFDNATRTTDTLTNSGYMRYTSITSDNDDTITVVWDHTKPSVISVNDVELTIIGPSGGTISLVFADNFTMRYNTVGPAIDCYGTLGNVISASVSDATDITVTLSSGTATMINTEAEPKTATYSYSTAYYTDSAGPYIMKYSNQPAFVHPDTSIIVANGTTIVGSRVGVYFEGTIEDGYTFSYFNTGATVTESNVVSDYTTVEGYSDVVALSKITMHLVKNTDEVDATYSYFLVPYEVTAERSIQMDGTISTVLNIIPLIIVAGVLLLAIVYFIRRA